MAQTTEGRMAAQDVDIPVGPVRLEGTLTVPAGARSIVVFAHGSGSSRHSPRNRAVAGVLQDLRIATLLMDLLTPHEEREDLADGHLRFDIDLLAQRLIGATTWLAHNTQTQELWMGYFGASTGAGAALVAAAARPERIRAIVSRGGRPDLAGSALERVAAPTLLIVGGEDREVLALNQAALAQLHSASGSRLEVIPGATHLFSEPGALERVAWLARGWFGRFLSPAREE